MNSIPNPKQTNPHDVAVAALKEAYEQVRSRPWWGWSNLWGTIAADRWAWFIDKKFTFFGRKTPLLRLELFSF